MTEKTTGNFSGNKENQQKWEAVFAKANNSASTGPKTTYSLQSMIDLVKYPVITEKTYLELYNKRQYTFDVDKRLTKTQIKKLVENLFNVTVLAVNTHIPPRKKLRVGMTQGFRPSFKRAIITLKEGQSINYSLKKEN
uniref:Large ribosomal subunit protein uL23c n=1 Tax=Chlamydomonas leiostraca TaxID=1034604 RepID=A0A1L2M558_9CHLO|nr:ribosomal protein L23 [Chlamydomonas leiostraca]APD80596.1 ribosomal protein L23 [Chlamydomonas leiostraca]